MAEGAAVVGALLLCGVLLWLPGLALVTWLLPGLPHLVRAAVAPAVSLGVLFALAAYLDVVGVPVRWQTVALPVVIASVAVLVVVLRRRRTRPRVGLEHLVLLAAVVIAYALWWYAIGSPQTVPPYDDGANAGIFVHRIGLLETVAPDQVIATDLGDGSGGVAYYPLALHLVASFLVALTGLEPGAALHVETATLVAVSLPVGVFALTRRLARPVRHVRPAVAAAAAALASAALPGMPWSHLPWGGLALVAGVSLMPGLLVLVPELWPRAALPVGVVLGAALAGVFAAHSSEVVSAVVIGAGLLVGWCGRRPRRWRRCLAAAAVSAGVSLVLLGPVLTALGGGLGERSAGTPGPAYALHDAVRNGWFSMLTAPRLADQWGTRQLYLAWVLTALVVLGAVVARRSRPVLGMTVASVLLAGVAVWAMVGSELARRLATPWYANGPRLLATLTVPILVLAGVGVAWLAGRTRTRIALVAIVGAVAVLVPAIATCAVLGSRTYNAYSVVTSGDRDTYAWLAEHVDPGERVLNDSHDGSMWMYPLQTVAPVFGPKSDLWQTAAWDERWYLLEHAADLGSDVRAQQAARDLGVRYIVVGERVVFGAGRQLDPGALLDSAALQEVYRSGSARVFEILG